MRKKQIYHNFQEKFNPENGLVSVNQLVAVLKIWLGNFFGRLGYIPVRCNERKKTSVHPTCERKLRK